MVHETCVLHLRGADGALRSASATVVEAGAVVRPSVYVRPHLRLELPIWIGTVLRGVEVRDAGEADFGLRGLSVGASLAVAWTTWTFAPRRRAG